MQPNFLGGWLAADQQRNMGEQLRMQQQAHQLQQLGGMLALQNAIAEQQMTPLKLEQLKQSIQRAAAQEEWLRRAGGGGQGPQGQLAQGAAQGDIGPTVTNANRAPQGGVDYAGGLLAGINPKLITALRDIQSPEMKINGGVAHDPRLLQHGQVLPQIQVTPEGRAVGVSGAAPGQMPSVAPLPGALNTYGAFKGLEADITAGRDLVPIPDGKGGTIMMPRSLAIQRLGGGSQAPAAVPSFPQQAPVAPIGDLSRESSLRGAALNIPPETAQPRDLAQIDRELSNPNLPPPARAILQQERARIAMATGQAPQAAAGPLGYTPPEAQRAAGKKREELGVTREADLPQAQLQVRTQLDDIDRLISLTNETMNAPSLSRSVGLVGAFPSIPGQPAANVDSLVDSLKAQVSGMKLQAMRNASKTGGAVGNVTEREWPRLESMIVALNKKMSPELFREKLGELVVEMNKAKSAISAAYEQEYSTTSGFQRRRDDAANDPLGIRRR